MPFRYPVCVTLDRYTGIQTAVLAVNEVAAREFVLNAQSSENADAYIRERCQKHGMLVSRSYIEEFQNRRSRYYVVQSYEMLEVFYREFRGEFEEFFGPNSWKQQSNEERKKEGDEGKLYEIFRNVPDGSKLKTDIYASIIEYYRVVRNCVVHAVPQQDVDRKLIKGTDKLRERLAERYKKEVPSKEYAFDAPNSINALTFDDVRLCSRCMQRLARLISGKTVPSSQQMVNAVFSGSGGDAFRRSFKKFAGVPNGKDDETRIRQKKALQFRLMERFGLTASEAAETLDNASWPIA